MCNCLCVIECTEFYSSQCLSSGKKNKMLSSWIKHGSLCIFLRPQNCHAYRIKSYMTWLWTLYRSYYYDSLWCATVSYLNALCIQYTEHLVKEHFPSTIDFAKEEVIMTKEPKRMLYSVYRLPSGVVITCKLEKADWKHVCPNLMATMRNSCTTFTLQLLLHIWIVQT